MNNNSASTTEIWLIRHGQTSWNVEQRLQGHSDTEIDQVGMTQAAAVGKYISRLHSFNTFDSIYSSDLIRAKQTADEIKNAIGVNIILDKRLREHCLGHFEGKTVGEIFSDSALAQSYTEFSENDDYRPQGGESSTEMHNRCYEALYDIVNREKGRRILVVSHGGFLHHALKIIKGSAMNGHYSTRSKVPNSCICHVIHDSISNTWSIEQWGYTKHLSEYLEHCDDIKHNLLL